MNKPKLPDSVSLAINSSVRVRTSLAIIDSTKSQSGYSCVYNHAQDHIASGVGDFVRGQMRSQVSLAVANSLNQAIREKIK